jgi:hypothetical protein
MTGKATKTIVHVIVVISLLSMVHLIHFWEPQIEGVPFGPTQTETGDADLTSIISNTDFGEGEPEFEFSEMRLGHFTENLGQWEDHIHFLAQTSFGYIGLGNDGVFYYILHENGGYVVTVTFQDAATVHPLGQKEFGFSSNYFYGNDPEAWVTEARSFKEVLYEDVWPGIDIIYFFKNKNIKYDIIVGQDAESGFISFRIEGHRNLEIEENRLVISISEGVTITDSDLMAFYEDGSTEAVRFKKIGDNTYGFHMDKEDGKKLIIDPIVFSSSTFLGGSQSDQARDMAQDTNDNIIILADTMSLDFPNTTGAFQTSNAGAMDIVITKMDYNSSYLIFSTYIGGWSFDFPYALDVDDNGDIYATGETWARDFPTTNGTFQEEAPAGSTNVFVLKLSSSGSDLIYSTYVGSSYPDWGRDIKIFNGYAYVVGYTYSYDFPYVDYPINNAHGTVFFFILNQNASNLTHTAFWGGHQNEIAYSLQIDFNGDVVVGGITNSKDFPITPGVYQEIAEDWNNGFLLRYRPTTSTLLFSTYIGGSALDEVRSIYLDENSDIYFSGVTNNPESSGQIPFPTTPGAYDRTYNGSKDAFIGKMSSDGTTLIFSTLYGSEGEEMVGSIDVDNQGNIYFIGNLDSDLNFTVTPDAFDYTYNQGDDVLFAVLNADCSDVLYSTYLGGNASDLGETCLLSATDEILLFGTTTSMDFPSTNGSYQTENDGSGVLFITKFVIGNFLFLHEGWNLISFPLVPTDSNLNFVLSSIKESYDAVQWYDSTDAIDHWKHHHTKKPSHLNDLGAIDHTMGFWVHITEPGGVLFEYTGAQLTENQIITLYPGWNLVGFPSLEYQTRENGLNNLTFDTHVNAIWSYDTAQQKTEMMEEEDHFLIGKGYYIHAKSQCQWEVPL